MTDLLYRHTKEITLTYQSTSLMELAIEAAIEKDTQFIDRTILEGLNQRYSNVCYMGMFIERVLAIQKRSSIAVGDFKSNGQELYQAHCVVQVECVVIQPQCVICCSVIETTQSQNNLKRLIIGKGIDQLDMVRVYINLDTSSKTHQNITITNGMILPCIAVDVKYTDGMISVFASPVIPMSFTYRYTFDSWESLADYEVYIEKYSELITKTRSQLKTLPAEAVERMCSILVRDVKDKDRDMHSLVAGKLGTHIEDVAMTKPSQITLYPLDCLLGTIRDVSNTPPEADEHENSGFLLVEMLIRVGRFMTVLEQLVQYYQNSGDIENLEEYMMLPGQEVV